MNDQELVDLVNRTLSEEFELEMDDMVPEATLYDDLGLDSLDTVDMVIVLESAFNVKLREEKAIQSIRTLGDIYKFIVSRKKDVEGSS